MDKEMDDINTAISEDQINGDVEGAVGPRSELSKSAENLTIDQRIKRKAKRVIRQLSKEAVPNGHHVVQTTRHWKNSRRPRNGKGRGLPKKGNLLYIFCYKSLDLINRFYCRILISSLYILFCMGNVWYIQIFQQVPCLHVL